MMPIVFWASFEPCEKAMNPAETTCRRLKAVVIGLRWALRKSQNRKTTRTRATTKPIRGELIIGTRTLSKMPCGLKAAGPAATRVAPSRPPIRAWLLDDGRPSHHVSRFQAMAPMSAAATTAVVEVVSSTRPEPMVLATAVPAKAPMKLNDVAMMIA